MFVKLAYPPVQVLQPFDVSMSVGGDDGDVHHYWDQGLRKAQYVLHTISDEEGDDEHVPPAVEYVEGVSDGGPSAKTTVGARC